MPENNVRISVIRLELKHWEKTFALENGGRKASREEIKKNASIAAKYKEYNNIRDLLSGRAPVSPKKKSLKGHKDVPLVKTPRKPRRHVSTTPSRDDRDGRGSNGEWTASVSMQEQDQDNEEELENRTPQKAFIGPTPQKDGRVLGLFDLLSPIRRQTPTKTRAVFQDISNRASANTLATPTKLTAYTSPRYSASTPKTGEKRTFASLENEDILEKHSRTPLSSSERFLLDPFMTPSKRRRLSNDVASTPTSAARAAPSDVLDFGLRTPAFLRRHTSQPLSMVAEQDGEGDTGNAATMSIGSPKVSSRWYTRQNRSTLGGRPMGTSRSLSSMIADMRRQEEEQFDEEMDIMREMEMSDGRIRHVQQRASTQVLTGDSEMPADAELSRLGPDGTSGTSENAESNKEILGRDGKPLRVWKKKGMKRQTKRINMLPAGRPKPAAQNTKPWHDEESESETTEVIAETQLHYPNHNVETAISENVDEESDVESRFSASEGSASSDDDDFDGGEKRSKSRRTTVPAETKDATSTLQSYGNDKSEEKGKEGIVKRAVRKVKATAHANFRRLKIRSSKGAKASARGVGRFGSGRR